MTLGERIVAIRKEKGITQKDFAEQLGITATRLNYWEKDKRFPPVPMLNLIAECLDVDSDYLIGRKESPEIKKDPTPVKTRAGEVTAEQIMQAFVSAGFVPAGQDLTDEDLRFLQSIFAAIANWFASRDARSADSDKSTQ